MDVDDVQSDAVLTSLQAKLDAVSKKVASPRIDMAGASSALAQVTAVEAALDRLAAKDPKVKASLDDTEAKTKLDVLKAKLDAWGRSRATATANVDTAGAQAGMMAMAMWPAIIAGVGAALPVIPAGLAAAGAAAGALVLAFEPVIKALTDWSAASQQAGQSSAQLAATAQSNAVAIANAERAVSDARTQAAHDAVTSSQQVASAEQSLADAQRTADQDAISGAESVARAEQSLANAQQSEQMAQQNLTQARAQAKLTLEQLNNAEADGALQAKRAAFNLQDAQLNQQQVDASATSTALQKAEAAQSVAEAQQALLEAQQNATNSTDAANQANQEGVDGLPAVVSAQNAYQQAVQGVANAQQALQDASRQAADQQQKDAEAIANAQQSVANAVQQAGWTQQKDAEAIQTAVDNLNNTYKSQQLQAAAAAAASGAASAKFQKDMAAMSGPGQQVVNMLIGMGKELKPLSNAAQTAIMPGVLAFLKGVNSLLPLIGPEIKTMGGILGDAFKSWGSILQSSGFQRELKTIFDDGNQFLQVVLPAITGLVGAFIKMGANSGGAVSGLAQGLSAIMSGFGQLFAQLSQPKTAAAIGQLFQGIGQVLGALLPLLGPVIGALAELLGPLLIALAPAISKVAGALAAMLNAIPGPVLLAVSGVKGLITALDAVVKYLPQVPGAFQRAWSDVVKWSADGAHLVASWFDFIRHSAASIGDDIARPFIDGWNVTLNFFGQLPGAIFRILSGIADGAVTIGKDIIVGLWNGMISQLGPFGSFLNWIGSTFIPSKKGPPEKDRQLLAPAGKAIMRGLTDSISGELPQLNSTLQRVTSAVSAGVAGPGYAAGGYGGGSAAVVFNMGSAGTGLEAQFKVWFRNMIRDGGGSPEILNRKVVFA